MQLVNLINQEKIVTDAINDFKTQYHKDFFATKNAAEEYIASHNLENCIKLARILKSVLMSWGAGKRRAPSVKSEEMLVEALQDKTFYIFANLFNKQSIRNLSEHTPSSLEIDLINGLNLISEKILVGNSSITYPMKVLLLLTGFMPAWDSKVRKGLEISGFRGVNFASFSLPNKPKSTTGKKIASLPFYLKDFYEANFDFLNSAIKKSRYPDLAKNLGRLFDVLFFIQGSTGKRILIFKSIPPKWYK
jgi:hypothetical protein